tara:strand:- start:1169 stop:1390 length:222 start_codon:yes stop_codon:yes gene_type:complete
MDDIEYLSTESLVREIQSRFDESVIVAASRRNKDEDDMVVCLGGAYHGILGLIVIARMAAEQGDPTDGTNTTD